MPMYDYRCLDPKCGHVFEDLRPVDARTTAGCPKCHCLSKQLISAAHINPNSDLPGLRMKQRKGMERRGRGADMTNANRTVTDEQTARDAHAKRQARGENPIISI